MSHTQHAIFFEYTAAGVAAAERDLAQIKDSLNTTSTHTATATPVTPHPAVVLYQAMDPNRSREFLEALSADGKTFDELSPHLSPNDDGSSLSASQVRAVYRNVRRREEGLLSDGRISRRVVQADFEQYEQEQAGRYSLTRADLGALDPLLGR